MIPLLLIAALGCLGWCPACEGVARPLPPTAPPSHLNPLDHFVTAAARVGLDGSIHLRVNDTVLRGVSQWVTVSWGGVPWPTWDDYIALYPAGADVHATAPIKFKLAASSPSHLPLGSGSAR